MIYLRKAKSREELKQCVDLYSEQEEDELFKIDRLVSLTNLTSQSKLEFFRVIMENEKVSGWILAHKTLNQFNGLNELSQQFYTSSFSGLKAVKAVVLAHKEMINYAEACRIPVVTSHASHNDLALVLPRILAKNGWSTRGYFALWKTSWYPKHLGAASARLEPL